MNGNVKNKRNLWVYLFYLLLLLIVGQTTYHHIMIRVESKWIRPLGQLVNVNGHDMHIYSDGKKEEPTLVFLSGSGTSAPIYDFKSIYSKFSTDYRIVVVERAGYGYSETSGLSRSLDVILEETRQALIMAGEEAPYIIVPHSISGIESLYWAQKYPEEVKGIIGLDMSVPEAANSIKIFPLSDIIMKTARFIGLQRIPFIYPIEYVELTHEEMKQARYLTNRNAFNIDMRNEISAMFNNFDLINYSMLQETPILNFVSNEEDSKEEINEFTASVNCELIYLKVGHYVHQFESDTIYNKGKHFIENLEYR